MNSLFHLYDNNNTYLGATTSSYEAYDFKAQGFGYYIEELPISFTIAGEVYEVMYEPMVLDGMYSFFN